MANTPNFNLYKPARTDNTVDVDTSLTTNFTIIDTELKTNKDGLDTHKNNVNAHASDKITHADGSVKTTLDNHEERIVVAEMDIFNLDSRVDDLEVNGVGGGSIPPDLENRLTTVESDVEGILAPATFDAIQSQSYTFDEYRIGYVDSKLAGKVSSVNGIAPDVNGNVVVSGSGGPTDWSEITSKPTTFTPPVASASILGGVKIGSGITVDVNGVISASGGGGTNATQIQGKTVAVPSVTNTLARFNGTSIDWIPTPTGDTGGSLKTIEDYGAVAGADTSQPVASVMTANLNAINSMLTNEGYAIIPANVYWINGSVNVRGGQQLLGFGRNQSFLYVASGANYPAVDIGNVDGAKVSSFGVIYNDWNPESYTNRNAFYFHDEVRDSEFNDLYAQSIYRAFYLDDSSSAQHNLWSCNFRNLKCYWYAKNMFYFNPQIGGNTGCVFENIYAHNGTRDNRKAEIVTPFNFQKFTESVCLQMNAEWSNVDNCFFLQSNRNMVFISTHIEGVDIKAENGLIHVVDGAAHFMTLDIYDVNFDSGGQAGVFRVNYGGLLKVEGLTETASTLISGSVVGVISETVAGEDDRVEITGARTGITTNFVPTVNVNSTSNLPKLIRYNDEVHYQKVGSNIVSYGTAAPTTGTWARGDKVYNTAPAASGYTGWVCVTAGTPGTWKGFGAIQA